jgi:hypothetical protein
MKTTKQKLDVIGKDKIDIEIDWIIKSLCIYDKNDEEIKSNYFI